MVRLTNIKYLRHFYHVSWTVFLAIVVYEFEKTIEVNLYRSILSSSDKGLIKDYMYREWVSGINGIYIKESDPIADTSVLKLINPVQMTQLMFDKVFPKVGTASKDEISEKIIVLNKNSSSDELNQTELEAIEYFRSNMHGSGTQKLLKDLDRPGIINLQEPMGPAGPPPGNPLGENPPDRLHNIQKQPAPETDGDMPAGPPGSARESYTKIVNEDGTNYLKIIKPIRTTETCMSCHDRKQYYAGGDLVAITSYSASISQAEKTLSAINTKIYVIGAFIWLLGVFAMEFGYRKYRQYTRKLESTNRQLEISEHKLSELNDNKDKYFSILSHDLKNSFQSILSYSDYLVADFENIEKTDLKEGIKNCNFSSKKIYRLLEDLLTWNKMQTGTLGYEPVEFSANEIVNENIELLSEKANRKDIRLKNEVDENTIIYADPDMFKAVIRNLFSNAIKFTGRNGEVKITNHKTDKNITFSVIDNGVGISKENMERLFKLNDSFTTRGTNQEKGTGLGLIICKDMIKKHGGEIWVESTPGKGSAFNFTIPARTG